MKTIKLFLLLIFAAIGSLTNAQEFKQVAGIRLGLSPGFEYRIFADAENSYKFLLSTRDRGIQFHVFKEFHNYDMFDFTDQLVFFYGGGLHAGYERWDIKYYDHYSQWYTTHTAFIVGLDALVGLEYIFDKAPISVGVEVKPYFEFFGQEFFDLQLFDFALTAKYLF